MNERHQPVPHDELGTYLTALYGRAQRGSRVEVRYREPGSAGMQQRFYAPAALIRAQPTIRVLARRHDVYLGVAPRTERRGGLDAIQRTGPSGPTATATPPSSATSPSRRR